MDKAQLWNDLLDDLKKYGIQFTFEDITKYQEGKQTVAFCAFNANILRALLPLTISNENGKFFYNLKNFLYPSNFIYEITLILLITSLEVFLRRLFLSIAIYTKLKDIDSKFLKDFLKDFRIKDQIIEESLSNNNINFPLFEILKKKRLDLQNKYLCKLAFRSMNFDIYSLIDQVDNDLWRRVYSNDEYSPGYIKIRNELIHRGVEKSVPYLSNMDFEFIKKVILDIVKFVVIIEEKAISKYPKQDFPNVYFK